MIPSSVQLLEFQLSVYEAVIWFLLLLCYLRRLGNGAPRDLISVGFSVAPVATCPSLVGDGPLCYCTRVSSATSCARFLCGSVPPAELLLWWLCSISAPPSLPVPMAAGACPALPPTAEEAGLRAVRQRRGRLVLLGPACISPDRFEECPSVSARKQFFPPHYKTVAAKDTCCEAHSEREVLQSLLKVCK